MTLIRLSHRVSDDLIYPVFHWCCNKWSNLLSANSGFTLQRIRNMPHCYDLNLFSGVY